ncbi:MAG: helix-turn-helix domain-containing protein [Weeksellaceae bacterium]
MSLQLYSHTKNDLERAVEIILNKANQVIISKSAQPTDEHEKLISQKEAAKFLQISDPTIIDWRKNKGLPHYEFHGRFYYSKKELLEYGRRNHQNKKA